VLNTPDTNGLTVVSLVSLDDSKIIVVEVTLDTCPVKTASPDNPALTTVKTGAFAGFEAVFEIVFCILPEIPATFGAEQSMEGRRNEKVKILLTSRDLFMIGHFIRLELNIT